MSSKVADTIDKIQEYIEVKFEFLKYKILVHTSKTLAGIITLSILILFGFFLLFFLSFAIAIVLNESMDSAYLGYFIVCGFYLAVVLLVLLLFRRGTIQKLFENVIIAIAKEQDGEED
ncbi:MAG: phage holin family protein [Bacteroidota bacterium]